MMAPDDVVVKMRSQIEAWEQVGDPRALFLRCYLLMTGNMLAALENDIFYDPGWVRHLLERFAEYYFTALETYDFDHEAAPSVWRMAFLITAQPRCHGLQRLLLGINAHINYDLVLALVDVLQQEWAEMPEEKRSQRYSDHCHVNNVIGRTLDEVQDQVLEKDQPWMDIIDKALGPLDEFLISRLITHWRDAVWRWATELLDSSGEEQRWETIRLIENGALEKAQALGAARWDDFIKDLL
jgi:hypothetical protein